MEQSWSPHRGGTPSGPASDAADWSDLMRRAQQGDRVAYAALLRSIVPYLQRLAAQHHCAREDIDDTVQDILLTIHSVRHPYDPCRPFGPWLVAIARRRLVDQRRWRARHAARETDLTARHETFSMPETNLYEGEVRRLQQAIAALPNGQRRAVEMLKLRELTLKEASQKSGMSVTALKVAAHRALKTLRVLIIGEGERI